MWWARAAEDTAYGTARTAGRAQRCVQPRPEGTSDERQKRGPESRRARQLSRVRRSAQGPQRTEDNDVTTPHRCSDGQPKRKTVRFCHVVHRDIAGLIAGIDSIEYVDDYDRCSVRQNASRGTSSVPPPGLSTFHCNIGPVRAYDGRQNASRGR